MWTVGGARNYFCLSNTKRNKALSLHFQLSFFSYTSLVLAFSSIVAADLGFTICFVGPVNSSFTGHWSIRFECCRTNFTASVANFCRDLLRKCS